MAAIKNYLDGLADRTAVAENLMECLNVGFYRKREVGFAGEAVVGGVVMGAECFGGLSGLEEREKEFDGLRDGKRRKVASEEVEMGVKKESFVSDFDKTSDEKLVKPLVCVNGCTELLDVPKSGVRGSRKRMRAMKKLKKKKQCEEQSLRSCREALAEKERKVDMIIGVLDERIAAVDARDFFLEEKTRELELKEERLSLKCEEFDKKFSEQEKLRLGAVEKLEVVENKLERMREAMDERIKEIEFRENVALESAAASVKEADLIRKAAENQLEKFEKMKREFDIFQEGKMRELVVKEQQLDVMSMEIARYAKLRDRQLSEREELGHQLLKRLESAKDNVENLKSVVNVRFQEISLRQIEVNRIGDWLEREMDEVDSKQNKLEEREKGIIIKEENLISKENELLGKEKERDLKEKGLDLMEKNLLSWQKQLAVKQRDADSEQKLNDQRLVELDQEEKSVNSEVTNRCFMENVAASIEEADILRDAAENQLEEFEKIKRDQEAKMRELVVKEQQVDVMSKELAEDAKVQKEFKSFLEEKMRELVWKEEQLSMKCEEFVNEVKLAYEKFRKRFKSFLEVKMRELVLKEEQLSMKRDEFVREVKLADEKFSKQEELRLGAVEKLEMAENKLERMREAIDERLKEIELRENVGWENVAASIKEADIIREAAENQLEEIEKIKREFNSFHVDKMRELIAKEKQLDLMSMELVRDATLRDSQLSEREKLGHQLLKRLESTIDNVENLKSVVDERFREITLRQIEVKRIGDWLERQIVEVDSEQNNLEEREKRIIINEQNMISKENELLGNEKDRDLKEKGLDLKEKNLLSWQKQLAVKQREVDSKKKLHDQRLVELDRKEKSVNLLREVTNKCFKEYISIKQQLRFERDLVEKRAQDLELKKQQLEHMKRELEQRELALMERELVDYIEGLKLKPLGFSDVFDSRMKIDCVESVDLKFTVTMDGKTLQMFLNDPEKDLESRGDEIFKVLHHSSNPAKLILDAMVGFYPPHLKKEDEELNVRRTCIVLLEQLTKMSLNIQPCVRDEAIELARSWKSRMRTNVENPLEVLGFLHLLAAYDLASCFDKSEVLSFLLMVAQHKQASELRHLLGFP